jgi:molecular chaperone DnaK
MKTYVGIDLGTTNSAICSYDGESVHLYKSPEQNDVTPSAILIDSRGHRYYGQRAYDTAPHSPDNAATLFKRLMGTNTPIKIPGAGLTLTPQDCSAAILRVLYGYLPEEIRADSGLGTVITVPAAFDQVQKEATMAAAEMAGIGQVALMQEPVAAVMSVMRTRKTDGIFLIFDLGGGTLDVAVAESIAGRVNLLANGGIAICGGREFDRLIVSNIVKPWLLERFSLPEDAAARAGYRSLLPLATWAAEKAKIQLSSSDVAVVSLSEAEMRIRDEKGTEIFLDVPLTRAALDGLIESHVLAAIGAARETLAKAGLTPNDVERIVFVGGPTHYKPLRDKVSFEIGVPGTTEVNPMTAVAEGAALFAESIDWSTAGRSRKNPRGTLSAGGSVGVTFTYLARIPANRTTIALSVTGLVSPGSEVQIDSLDSGWSSGRVALRDGALVEVSLAKPGENTFKVFVFDASGGPVTLANDRIVITRTAATVDAIPAAHSIGIAALDKLGGRQALVYLVRSGEPLPKKGQVTFRAGESLRAEADGSLNFRVFEGDISDPVEDNRHVGVLKIKGSDFTEGVVATGAELRCDYEVRDSGTIVIEVSVPTIAATFHSNRNFYSPQEGVPDYSTASRAVQEDAKSLVERVDAVSETVTDERLGQLRGMLSNATDLGKDETDPEVCKEAADSVLNAKKVLAQVRKDHLKPIRKLELEGFLEFFNAHIRELARPSEVTVIENLVRTAQRSIDQNDAGFENDLDELRSKNFEILWRQDWFVVDRFKWMAGSPHLFPDVQRFNELIQAGLGALKVDDFDRLRSIVANLYAIKVGASGEHDLAETTNIVWG